MLPSEFYSLYGKPVFRTVTLDDPVNNFRLSVIPSDDRYLLIFYLRTFTAWLVPDSAAQTSEGGFQISAAGPPTVFTHALHGAAVNLGWSVIRDTDNCEVTVMEGFMRPVTTRKGRGIRGTKVHEGKDVHHLGDGRATSPAVGVPRRTSRKGTR